MTATDPRPLPAGQVLRTMQGGGLVQATGVLAEHGAADRRAGCGDRGDTWLVSVGR